MRRIILIAAFIYLLIAPLTYHTDNKEVLAWAGADHGRVWNIWNYGQKHLTSQFNYPPFHFYLAKLEYGAADIIGGAGYRKWLYKSNDLDPFEPNLSRYSFATKFVLLIFALISGYLVYLIAKRYKWDERQARLAACLWYFNPITLYSVIMMGQNDVMAITFFLLGWYLIGKRNISAALMFGLAASIKFYPLLWLVFLLPNLGEVNAKNKFKIFFGSLIVFLATLLPFVFNAAFRTGVFGSSINERFFIPQIDLGFSEHVFIVPLILALLFYSASIRKSLGAREASYVVMCSSLVLLGFSHFHPQWFTWLIPFWALWISKEDNKESLIKKSIVSVIALACWATIVALFNDKHLTYGIFSVVNPTLINLPSPYDYLGMQHFNVLKYTNYAHTGIASLALLAVVGSFMKMHSDSFSKFELPMIKHVRSFLFLFFAAVIAAIIVLNLIPSPITSIPPITQKYLQLDKPMAQTIVAQENNLYRVDVLLDNHRLDSNAAYNITIDDGQSTLITQNFSGSNTGYRQNIRFDMINQPASKGREYNIRITPLDKTKKVIPLDIGMIGNNFAYTVFYHPKPGIVAAIDRSTQRTSQIISQNALLFVILLILGLLIILDPFIPWDKLRINKISDNSDT